MMSSFSASFTPSARLCSRPNGPFTLGPMRCCIRATTRRSNQMLNSVSTTRITKISTALISISHHGSWPNCSRPGAPALGDRSNTVAITGRLPSRGRRTRARPGRRGRRCRWSSRAPRRCRRPGRRTSIGSVTEPRSPVRVTIAPSAADASGETRQTGVRAVARRYFSPSCIEPLSSISFQVASASEPSSDAAVAAGASGRLARSPSHGPISTIRRRASAEVRKPSGRPSSSAIPARTRASGRALGLTKTASNARTRPSQFTNMPALSVTGATGKTTSAAAVTSVSRCSRATTKLAASRAARNADGSAVSSGSTPPTTRPPSSPEDSAATIASPSRPALSGRLVDPPGGGGVDAGRGVGRRDDRRAGGSGRQPVSTAPRSPARRGTQASLAPVVRASRATAVRAPGTVAIRSPTRITLALSSSTSPSWARPATTSASAPGRVAISVPPILRRPFVANGATDQTRVRWWRLALRSRRKIVPASSSGSSPTRSTELAVSRSAYVAPWRRTTSAARKSASSAECGRDRKSMSWVPSATRANVL